MLTHIFKLRFDPLCGEFDKRQFSSDYNFLSELRMQDVKAIRAELKETQDPERELKLRRLLQRMTEQQRANKKKTAEKEKLLKEKINVEQQFKQGKQPRFKNKCKLFRSVYIRLLCIYNGQSKSTNGF